ncbi:peptide chain release factor 2 [Patescibacteria group bacterium]|nr:peptide chain release factor 2 [Patescibacteria group bacterium]
MEEIKKRIELVKQNLNLPEIQRQIKEIEVQSSSSEFWQNQAVASGKMKKLGELQKELEEVDQLEKLLAAGQTAELEKRLAKLELKTFLSGQYDASPAIFSIHAGQGGTEAMDWAAMLKRMYLRYFEKKDWPSKIIDETAGDEAGIKSTTIAVDVSYAYGYLKLEAGTHRLVRQSPFNADKLRQTSFALVEVLPQIEENSEIKIKEDDLDWQFYRASGHGGQNVQKVSSAVRLIHRPTGIVVTCQIERYQEQNRRIALDLLRAKLWGLQQAQAKQEEKNLKGGRTKGSWGTQIRSYVLHPYKMVKDLRTGYESANPDSVLDGNLDEFVEAELKSMV